MQACNGVPQGTILGPILFSIYINDLPNFIKDKAEVIMYADDCALIISGEDEKEIEFKVNDALKSVEKWFSQNNLKMNLEKTSYLLLKKSYLTKHMWKIKLDDKFKNIKEVQCQKFLGTLIDEHLNWNAQTDKLCSSLKSLTYLFKNLKKYCDNETLKTVYYSYVQSKINEGILVWGSSKKQNIEAILKYQKKIIRIINGAKYLDSCRPLFKKLNVLTVPSLIIKENCLLLKRNIHKYSTKINVEKVYNTRSKSETGMLNVEKSCIMNFSTNLYNKIPESIRKEENYNGFKKKLTEYLSGRCLYSLEEFLNDDFE